MWEIDRAFDGIMEYWNNGSEILWSDATEGPMGSFIKSTLQLVAVITFSPEEIVYRPPNAYLMHYLKWEVS